MNSPGPAGPGPRRKFLLPVLILLLLALAIAALPTYRFLKQARAHWIVSDARTLLDQGDKVGALHKGAAAYQLAPLDPEVLYLMAVLYEDVNPEYSLHFWTQLRERKELAPEERTDFVRYSIHMGRPALAQDEIGHILKDPASSDAALLLAAEYELAAGTPDQAVALCRKILERTPGDRNARLFMARLLILSKNWPEAKKQLEILSQAEDDVALQSLLLLSHLPDQGLDDLAALAAKIRMHPKAGEKEKLLAEEILLNIHPSRKQEILENVEKKAETEKPDDRLETARWLNRQGEYARVQQLFTLEEALKRRDLFLVWADAMAAGGRWQELETVLEKSNVPLERPLVTAFRARAARELQDPKRADLLWDQAVSEAAPKPEILWFMVSYAEKLKDYGLARRACQRLTREPSTQRAACLTLLRLAESEKNTREIRGALEQILRLFPQDKAAANDLAYMNLLLGEKIPESTALAFEQQGKDPLLMSYRVTAALALLRTGRAERALRLYDDLEPGQLAELRPRWKAVYAAVLKASGNPARAMEIAKSIRTDLLLPEEKDLLKGLGVE